MASERPTADTYASTLKRLIDCAFRAYDSGMCVCEHRTHHRHHPLKADDMYSIHALHGCIYAHLFSVCSEFQVSRVSTKGVWVV